MNKFLITIDRSTIRKNPLYGKSTPSYLAGKREMSVVFYNHKIPADFDKWFVMIKCSMDGEVHGVGVGDVVGAMKYLEGLDSEQFKFSSTVTQHAIPIPQYEHPEWLYDYNKRTVVCTYCDATMQYTQLEECDEVYDLDYYDSNSHSSLVCPVCGEWECVELEFQQFNKNMVIK